jgi:hypothetical protein
LRKDAIKIGAENSSLPATVSQPQSLVRKFT